MYYLPAKLLLEPCGSTLPFVRIAWPDLDSDSEATAVVSPPTAVSLVVLSTRQLLEPCGSTLPAICVALPGSNPDAEAT